MERRGRSNPGPEHIATILDALFKEQRLAESLRVHRALVAWDSLVGDAISRHATAALVEHGTLIVEVDSPGWMHRLQMQESELRTRINRHCGEEIIRQIRFRLGSVLPPKADPEEQEG